METGHTYPSTSRHVRLASGRVEISDAKNPRKKRIETFSNVLVSGITDAEFRQSFSYSKAFPWYKRAPIRELERTGLVRLVDLTVGRQLGLGTGEHPVPERNPYNDII